MVKKFVYFILTFNHLIKYSCGGGGLCDNILYIWDLTYCTHVTRYIIFKKIVTHNIPQHDSYSWYTEMFTHVHMYTHFALVVVVVGVSLLTWNAWENEHVQTCMNEPEKSSIRVLFVNEKTEKESHFQSNM